MKISGNCSNSIVLYGNGKSDTYEKANVLVKSEEAARLEISQEGRNAFALKDKAEFGREVKQYDKARNDLPQYSGIFSADKVVAAALENCGREEQAFVYDIIRQNFLVKNRESMTEEERQANISLGMKKAEYAAENFVSEDSRTAFLDAMETMAKLASAGKADADGNMNYGVKAGKYLGHGSHLVYTTDELDMMRTMDPDAYAEYRKIDRESTDEDRSLNTMRYLADWYHRMIASDKNMVDRYESRSDRYVEEHVKNKKLDTTFATLRTDSKAAFMEDLKAFQNDHPGFLSFIIQRELVMDFYAR